MVDRSFRALRQSDPVTRETNLMEKAISTPSSLSYLHQFILSPNSSPNVTPPNVGGSITEIDHKITTLNNTNRAVEQSNVVEPKDDNKLNKRSESILASNSMAGTSTVEMSSNNRNNKKLLGAGSLFQYQGIPEPVAHRSLPPLLTPGSDLTPSLLKEEMGGRSTVAPWARILGSNG